MYVLIFLTYPLKIYQFIGVAIVSGPVRSAIERSLIYKYIDTILTLIVLGNKKITLKFIFLNYTVFSVLLNLML